jgi:hypothetical protein
MKHLGQRKIQRATRYKASKEYMNESKNRCKTFYLQGTYKLSPTRYYICIFMYISNLHSSQFSIICSYKIAQRQ